MKSTFPTRALADIASRIDYGLTASASHAAIGPKFLRITDIVPPQIDWPSVPFCAASAKTAERYRLLQGDIVIARTGATVGYAKLIRDAPDAVFASYLVRVRVTSDHDPMYVGQVVSSDDYKRFVKANAGGAAQPNANARVLTSYPVPLPALPIQRKIGAVLMAYDDLIENINRRNQILEEMAQRMYGQWFVDYRYPGHDNDSLIHSDVGPIPDGWTAAPLASLATITMGQSPPSSAYNRDGVGLPFHQGVGSYGAIFPFHSVYSSEGDRIAETGDVLVSVRAPVGRVNLADRRLILGRGLCAIRPAAAPRGYLWQALKHFFREEDVMGGGSIFQSVTKREVEGLKLPWPGPALASRFAAVVEPIWNLLGLLTSQADNLSKTRDLLLSGLISGEIDLADLDIAMPPNAA